MTIEDEELKEPLFQRIREKVSEKWERFFANNKTAIGIVVIILLGAIACSPILVFSSTKFLTSIPIFYKIPAFVVFSVLFLKYYFKLTIKTISKQSKTLKTFYGWDDAIAVLLLIYGIFCFWMQPTVGFLEEFRAELIGAGIATLLIGNASQAAQIREEKKRLILQMGSPDNGFAVEAVRQLREHGWLQDGSLKGAVLHKANLSGADLSGANLSGASLGRANLSGASLGRANLSGAELWQTDLSLADLDEANLFGADMEMAYLHRAKLFNADLHGVDLAGAILSEADLRGTNLSVSYVRFADLSKANLWEANLKGSCFWDVNLNGTNLSGVDLSETTDWRDAFYTEGENGTVFPDGFDPADNGTQLIQENSIYEEAFKKVAPYFW